MFKMLESKNCLIFFCFVLFCFVLFCFVYIYIYINRETKIVRNIFKNPNATEKQIDVGDVTGQLVEIGS